MNLKQVIVIRKDLKLGKGKLAVQACHAVILASDKSKFKDKWEEEGQKKVVVWCKDLRDLILLYRRAKRNNLPVALVADAGLTQIKKGTKTCLGIGPAPEKEIDQVTGELKLI
jgi:PTH2 family peptidyl-tRNA hydrolase